MHALAASHCLVTGTPRTWNKQAFPACHLIHLVMDPVQAACPAKLSALSALAAEVEVALAAVDQCEKAAVRGMMGRRDQEQGVHVWGWVLSQPQPC